MPWAWSPLKHHTDHDSRSLLSIYKYTQPYRQITPGSPRLASFWASPCLSHLLVLLLLHFDLTARPLGKCCCCVWREGMGRAAGILREGEERRGSSGVPRLHLTSGGNSKQPAAANTQVVAHKSLYRYTCPMDATRGFVGVHRWMPSGNSVFGRHFEADATGFVDRTLSSTSIRPHAFAPFLPSCSSSLLVLLLPHNTPMKQLCQRTP